MISKDEQLRASPTEQAAQWFVLNDEGPLDERQSEALVAWLKASPVHVEAFLGVSVIARDLRAACADPEHSAASLLARTQADDDVSVESLWSRVLGAVRDVSIPRWHTAAVSMAAIIAVVTVGLWLWQPRPATPPVRALATLTTLHFETRHGEQQTHNLEDGSVLRLNTDTRVTVRYSKRERLITLTSGEAEFEVAHAPDRSFRVLAGPAAVVDLGTRFDVRLEDRSTLVTVVEGRVAVGHSPAAEARGADSSPGAPPLVYLNADQQLLVAEDSWPATPVRVDAQRTTAWLRRQIMFENEPLERVASEFNRYASKPIEISTPELRALQISGVFATDNNAAFIAFLRSLDGVRVEVTEERIVVSHK
jgi:transmembrane sensor